MAYLRTPELLTATDKNGDEADIQVNPVTADVDGEIHNLSDDYIRDTMRRFDLEYIQGTRPFAAFEMVIGAVRLPAIVTIIVPGVTETTDVTVLGIRTQEMIRCSTGPATVTFDITVPDEQIFTLISSQLAPKPPRKISWKKVVQNCADAYRAASGTSQAIPIGKLGELIGSLIGTESLTGVIGELYGYTKASLLSFTPGSDDEEFIVKHGLGVIPKMAIVDTLDWYGSRKSRSVFDYYFMIMLQRPDYNYGNNFLYASYGGNYYSTATECVVPAESYQKMTNESDLYLNGFIDSGFFGAGNTYRVAVFGK